MGSAVSIFVASLWQGNWWLLQGRAALLDTVLLFCYRIKQEYGGIVRGIYLGSAALNILPVLDSETEDWWICKAAAGLCFLHQQLILSIERLRVGFVV